MSEHPDVAQKFARRIAAIAIEPEAPSDDGLDADARAKLLALGYLGGSNEARFDSGKDPKKLIASANAMFRGITLFINQNNPRAALPFLQRAYRADPENAMTVFNLAFCLNMLGDVPTAMSYYRRAIELSPRAAEAYAHLAVLEFESGRRDEAWELLETGFAHSPGAFPLLITSGDLSIDIAETERADSLYREAAEAEPRRPEPWAKLARIAERAGDEARAREMWGRAMELDPTHALIPPRVRNRTPSR